MLSVCTTVPCNPSLPVAMRRCLHFAVKTWHCSFPCRHIGTATLQKYTSLAISWISASFVMQKGADTQAVMLLFSGTNTYTWNYQSWLKELHLEIEILILFSRQVGRKITKWSSFWSQRYMGGKNRFPPFLFGTLITKQNYDSSKPPYFI